MEVKLGRAVVVVLSMVLGACSVTAHEEKLCRADVTQALINPETAEFFDFKTVDKAAFRAGVENWSWKQHDVLPGDRYKFGDQLKSAIDKVVAAASADNAAFRAYRIKAESRVGLKVTSNYVCAVTKGSCTCLQSDE